MKREKTIAIAAVLLAALMLSACDRCGDPVAKWNGSAPMACKGDKPSLH